MWECLYLWVLFLCIFLGGIVDSIAGGGGLITLPAYFAVGIPPHMALGTNKFASSLGTLTASFRYIKDKSVNFKVALTAAAAGIIGSPIGAKLAMAVDEKYLKYILLFTVPIIAVLILTKKDFGKPSGKILTMRKTIMLALTSGFVLGLYDGFFGPGTGTFLTLIFTSLIGLDIVKACGTTKIVNFATNISALITYALNGNVMFSVGLPCVIFAIAGNWIGSGLAIKNGVKVVKPIMIVTMALLLLKVGSELFKAM